MQRARAFLYICGGILTLAIAFHLGATQAHGQSGGGTIVAVAQGVGAGTTYLAVTSNGDVYSGGTADGSGPWRFTGNIFSGTPVQTEHATWGRVKADRR